MGKTVSEVVLSKAESWANQRNPTNAEATFFQSKEI